MDKEFLVEQLNQRAEGRLETAIGVTPIKESRNNFFRLTRVLIPVGIIRERIKTKEGEVEKISHFTIDADDLLPLIAKAAFDRYKEEWRKAEQLEFLNKIDVIQSQLDSILSIER